MLFGVQLSMRPTCFVGVELTDSAKISNPHHWLPNLLCCISSHSGDQPSRQGILDGGPKLVEKIKNPADMISWVDADKMCQFPHFQTPRSPTTAPFFPAFSFCFPAPTSGGGPQRGASAQPVACIRQDKTRARPARRLSKKNSTAPCNR
jgi:hypothetical protein